MYNFSKAVNKFTGHYLNFCWPFFAEFGFFLQEIWVRFNFIAPERHTIVCFCIAWAINFRHPTSIRSVWLSIWKINNKTLSFTYLSSSQSTVTNLEQVVKKFALQASKLAHFSLLYLRCNGRGDNGHIENWTCVELWWNFLSSGTLKIRITLCEWCGS